MWHASVCVHSRSGPIPFVLCDERTRDMLKRTALGLLDGVGTGETRRDRAAAVLHARRRLADHELALLTPEWCAIPAVDIAGGGVPW